MTAPAEQLDRHEKHSPTERAVNMVGMAVITYAFINLVKRIWNTVKDLSPTW